MRNIVFPIIFALLLHGCGLAQMMTAEGRAERAAYFREQEARDAIRRQEEANKKTAANIAACKAYGFTQGTTSFSNCLLQRDRDQAAAEQNAALMRQIQENHDRDERAASDARCRTDDHYRLYSMRCLK